MGKGRERRDRAKKWKGGKDRGMGAGEAGMRMEGTGGPLSQILDTPLTVLLTPDRGCSMAYECRVMLQLPPAQAWSQAINICERSGVYYTLRNPPRPGYNG
jgi:hypothetical protein